ncbi:FliH/SctL family protein [Cellulomonas soli]
MREDLGFVPARPVASTATVSLRGAFEVPAQRRAPSALVTESLTVDDVDERPLARVLPFRAAPVAARASQDVDESARAQGFAAGYAAGSREAARVAATEAQGVAALVEQAAAARAAEHARALQVLSAAASAAQARTQPVLDQVERRLHLAAVELAQALLGVELSDAERAGRAALARVLGNPRLPDAVDIRLHPRDLEALRAAGVDTTLAEGVVLTPDASLAPGDAVAEHPDGLLDARLGEALTRALDALLDPS